MFTLEERKFLVSFLERHEELVWDAHRELAKSVLQTLKDPLESVIVDTGDPQVQGYFVGIPMEHSKLLDQIMEDVLKQHGLPHKKSDIDKAWAEGGPYEIDGKTVILSAEVWRRIDDPEPIDTPVPRSVKGLPGGRNTPPPKPRKAPGVPKKKKEANGDETQAKTSPAKTRVKPKTSPAKT